MVPDFFPVLVPVPSVRVTSPVHHQRVTGSDAVLIKVYISLEEKCNLSRITAGH